MIKREILVDISDVNSMFAAQKDHEKLSPYNTN